MATKKKVELPSLSIDTGGIVTVARAASEARAQAAEFTTIEKSESVKLAGMASDRRKEEVAERNNYIGIIRVTGIEQAAVRVEFRMENGALSIEEEAYLDELYGATRPLLFGREKVVTEIIDPLALIKELQDKGLNSMDYLEVTIKKGMDHVITGSPHVVASEAFLPKEGFIATLNDIKSTLSDAAKEYTANYLDEALQPRVVLGTAKG